MLLLVGEGGCSRQCGGHGEEALCSFPLKKEAGEVHPVIFFMKKACSFSKAGSWKVGNAGLVLLAQPSFSFLLGYC